MIISQIGVFGVGGGFNRVGTPKVFKKKEKKFDTYAPVCHIHEHTQNQKPHTQIMRTKALILAAIVAVAGVANTSAQVYSANAVGYVNMSLPAGLMLIANPLNNGDNTLDTILPLPDTAAGTTVFRFDTTAQAYKQGITFVGFGLGWQSADPLEDKVLNPGEGFFIQALASMDITFVGDVPQGDLSNPIPGGNNLSIRSSEVPQEAPLGSPGVGLEFPALDGDTVYLWDPVGQAYQDSWSYIVIVAGVIEGWVSASVQTPGDGPIVGVGEAFFVQKTGPVDQSWDRSFSVN